MNSKTQAIAHGKYKGANGKGSDANTFFKSANGTTQLANIGNRQVWSADGDTTTTDTASPTVAVAVTPTPSAATPCGCPHWHKPSCFVGGLLIGALAMYLIHKSKA